MTKLIAAPLLLALAACATTPPPGELRSAAASQTLTPMPAASDSGVVLETAQAYRDQARRELAMRRAIAERERNQARNLVILIGDGMGVSTLTAARIRAGELAGRDGESTVTAQDRLHHTALVKTYTHDGQVSDSAGTATAFLTGTKTRNGVIGYGPEVARGECSGGEKQRSIIELAQQVGKATGIVTTTRITHATPAAAYAHSVERNWEADAAIEPDQQGRGCVDIARQLIEGEVGRRLDVVMGGGRGAFLPQGAADPEDAERGGGRDDGRDLIAEWRAANPDGTYVWNAAQLDAYDPEADGKLLALLDPSHMEYELDRANDAGGEPALADMVELAIRRLQQGEDGFVLLVEGGRIDHAHHAGNAARAVRDAVAFDDAVARTLALVDLADTLVVTTADHSHVFTIAGYPGRGNPILGPVAFDGEPQRGSDGKGYTTLGYANGPGAVNGERPDPHDHDTLAPDYRQQALVPLGSETHAGEDVVVRASGPGAHLFGGTIEQHTIFWIMRAALLGAD